MNTGKNRVKGLKTALFKKYQTDPLVKNPTDELNMSGNQLVVNATANPNVQRPKSPYDESFYQIPDYNQLAEADKTSKPDELTKNMTALDLTPTPFQKPPKPDWRDYVRAGVGAVSNIKGVQEDAQGRMNLAEKVQNLNDQPRYMPNEYEYMARPGSQSVIFAKHGAEVRTGTYTGAEEAELEQGEMFVLPNLDSYVVGGKKHSSGGEKFVLPQGTIVFSDYLKVPGTKKTFAQMAKGYDIEKYKETLENPHAKAVDRDTAQIMMDRNMKKLQELFGIQQAKNGNSTGEMEAQNMRSGQLGLISDPSLLTPEEQKQYYLSQGRFSNRDLENKTAQADALTQHLKSLDAADKTAAIAQKATEAKPNTAGAVTPSATTPVAPAVPSVLTPEQAKEFVKNQTLFGQQDLNNINDQLQQSTNTATKAGANTADATTAGTVSKGNGADPNSIYTKKTASGRSYYVEGQGEFKDKALAQQYANSPTKLLKNRLNEHYDQLNPILTDAFNMELRSASDVLKKNGIDASKLQVQNADDILETLEVGESFLKSMRDYYKSMGREKDLFDAKLDKGYNADVKVQKAAELVKQYVESSTFRKDVTDGRVDPNYIPQINEVPESYTENGQVKYRLPKASVNLEFSAKYQTAYRAIAAVKNEQRKAGDKDLLKGFRIAPEGLSDQTFLGQPISEVSGREGNTELGQLLGFEDEEPIKPLKPKEGVKTGDEGGDWNKKIKESPGGEYIRAPFDFPQLAPELYGMASSQMFAYQPTDYTAPYLMPQTLNIQPQLQDIDNSYTAAINAGADPNTALIATLGGKQRIYSEKQNFDAQQRAATDQYNAQARWQEDVYDMQSLDKVYNTLIAQADDAVTSQRQALVDSAAKKREMYNQEENRKALYINNFVRNYKVDGKTGAITVNPDTVTNLVDLGEMLYGNQTTLNSKKSTESTTTTTTK